MRKLEDNQFVITPQGCFCAACMPPHVDLGEPLVQVWDDFSTGWAMAPVCTVCKLSMPVFLGKEMEDAIDVDAEPGARVGDDRVRRDPRGAPAKPSGNSRGRNKHGRFDGPRLLR